VLYAELNAGGLDPAQEAALVQRLNALASGVRTLSPGVPLTSFGAQMRVCAQQMAPYVRPMLAAVGAPFAMAVRCFTLVSAWATSEAVAAVVLGVLSFTAQALLWLLALLAVLYLIWLLYRLLEEVGNKFQRRMQKYWESAKAEGGPGADEKIEAAKMLAERDTLAAQATFRAVMTRPDGVFARLQTIYNMGPAA
jgi:hypothetical protein